MDAQKTWKCTSYCLQAYTLWFTLQYTRSIAEAVYVLFSQIYSFPPCTPQLSIPTPRSALVNVLVNVNVMVPGTLRMKSQWCVPLLADHSACGSGARDTRSKRWEGVCVACVRIVSCFVWTVDCSGLYIICHVYIRMLLSISIRHALSSVDNVIIVIPDTVRKVM